MECGTQFSCLILFCLFFIFSFLKIVDSASQKIILRSNHDMTNPSYAVMKKNLKDGNLDLFVYLIPDLNSLTSSLKNESFKLIEIDNDELFKFLEKDLIKNPFDTKILERSTETDLQDCEEFFSKDSKNLLHFIDLSNMKINAEYIEKCFANTPMKSGSDLKTLWVFLPEKLTKTAEYLKNIIREKAKDNTENLLIQYRNEDKLLSMPKLRRLQQLSSPITTDSNITPILLSQEIVFFAIVFVFFVVIMMFLRGVDTPKTFEEKPLSINKEY